jgi:hypothetical protein
MSLMFTKFKTAGRAAVLAVVLGASALTAMPAQAAPGDPSFNFNLQLPDGGNLQLGTGNQNRPAPGFRPGPGRPDFCLTDRQIRFQLGDNGFDNVRVGRDLRRGWVEVFATNRRGAYTMQVNRCTGQVSNIQRIRRNGPDFGPGNGPGRPGAGFGLQFGY